MPGWEGSAHETGVLQDALGADLRPEEGKYYLVDAGYGMRKGFLAPYRGVRYHLKEQYQSQQKPENKEELFNHAQLCNVVERIFGILKRRFRILRSPPEYPFTAQVKLVFALTALHNFIRLHNDDKKDGNWTQEKGDEEQGTTEDGSHEDGQEGWALEMKELRDEIAEHMWSDYNMYFIKKKKIASRASGCTRRSRCSGRNLANPDAAYHGAKRSNAARQEPCVSSCQGTTRPDAAAAAYAFRTRIVMAIALRTQCVSSGRRVSRQISSRLSVKANVLRTTHATASPFRTTRATASAFWTRSVRAFFVPDAARVLRTQRVKAIFFQTERVKANVWTTLTMAHGT